MRAAQRHIADIEKRVARQSALVQQLATSGQDTAQAARTLHVLEQALGLTREHLRILLPAEMREISSGGLPAERTG